MNQKTGKASFEVVLTGEGVSPDTTRAGDLAELLQNMEKAIVETARSEGIKIADEPVVSLVGVEPGSNRLQLAIASMVVPAASLLSHAVADKNYDRIPRTAHEAVYAVSNQASRKKWAVSLLLEHDAPEIVSATISEENAVPAPPASPAISGTTIMYGTCIRVGGVKPKAEIRLAGGGMLYIEVSEDIARQLAISLYEEVCLEGEATWSTKDWSIEGFRATGVMAYRRTDAETAFRLLAEAAGSRWDDVDAEEYVRNLRPWGGRE